MLEAMGAGLPVVLAVRGQARSILEAAGGGIPVEPENPADLLDAVLRLRSDPSLRRTMGEAGRAHVAAHFDRRRIAERYWELLQRVAAG
jgi:glycosyltransferase involved in cell wall biosynthesis